MLFAWSGDENARLKKWRDEDPIALQDAFNTSQALVDYCKEGDAESVAQLISQAIEGEFLFAHVTQAFYIAINSFEVPIVRQFIDNGLVLDVNVFGEALHLVCEKAGEDPTDDRIARASEMLHLLVKGTSSVSDNSLPVDHLRASDGFTALCVACVVNSAPLVRSLLALGAEVNMLTRAASTPLNIAEDLKFAEIAQLLETRGAGRTPTEVLHNLRKFEGC
eukprot:GEMP01048493.1.p1 GENE.GEMP01048493.1~~GEMP01048493.1.p1  ORF type:complete len:221 (+),score=62.19 GEMP01048493.1:97-759(+)